MQIFFFFLRINNSFFFSLIRLWNDCIPYGVFEHLRLQDSRIRSLWHILTISNFFVQKYHSLYNSIVNRYLPKRTLSCLKKLFHFRTEITLHLTDLHFLTFLWIWFLALKVFFFYYNKVLWVCFYRLWPFQIIQLEVLVTAALLWFVFFLSVWLSIV